MSECKTVSFILASASPRRKKLLKEAGYHFKVLPSSVDESMFDPEEVSPLEHSIRLAYAKAADIAIKHPAKFVMGADTVVDIDGKYIGKAEDAKDAEWITRLLFSRPHKVITSVVLIRAEDKSEFIETDTTVVYPNILTDKQIKAHIKSGIWRGKAGAYGIQECGDEFVAKIDGSLTNVMGMPMEVVEKILKDAEKRGDIKP
jgi:septum formation protein